MNLEVDKPWLLFSFMNRQLVASTLSSLRATAKDWREPATEKPEDIAAAMYKVEGQLGWSLGCSHREAAGSRFKRGPTCLLSRYCDPIYGVNGEHDYPKSMRMTLDYLPEFSKEEKDLLKAHKPDAFGLNHYGTSFIKYDGGKYTTSHGHLVQGKSSWLFRAAWGYRKLLNWVMRLGFLQSTIL